MEISKKCYYLFKGSSWKLQRCLRNVLVGKRSMKGVFMVFWISTISIFGVFQRSVKGVSIVEFCFIILLFNGSHRCKERERERKIKESNFLSPFTYLLFLILARVCPIEMYFPLIYVNVTLATDGMITYWKEMHPHSATSPPLWVLSETIIGLSLGAVF